MPDNLDIEGAVYRDIKAYFETPGGELNAVGNIKNLYDQLSNSEMVGTFIGVPFTDSSIKGQGPGVTATGFYRTTLTIVTKTYAPDDKLSATLRAQVLAIRELMNRANLHTTLTGLSLDQTYFSIMEGSQQPGNEGKFRTHEFTYTIIHKVSK
jgi:hypothetical protein